MVKVEVTINITNHNPQV